MTAIPSISIMDLKAKYDAKESFVLVDVREPSEYARCRLPGSKLIPLGELPARIGELDASAQTIVHCRSGGRSAKAVRLLMEKGFSRVFNLSGGILAWAEQADPSMEVD
ncbi:MAG: rhodanese-like domain-containing protein [Elusimicrobiota bacterium]|jgi:adenylyltransferase/sulfurtransferase